jgi:cobalt-zinc-cadmium efflux system outer membrane protein
VKKDVAHRVCDIGTLLRDPAFALCPLLFAVFLFATLFVVPANESLAAENELKLQDLIEEALKNSPEVLAAEARVAASKYRIPQATSLPDPMFMFGYQNEGWEKYTYGESQDAQWMFSVSQMFPFPGKLFLKGEMAAKDSEGLESSLSAVRLKTVSRVKELFFDLYHAYKDIDLIKDKAVLFSRIEEAALARYSAGMGQQQEVLMAQIEKYMLLEREEMLRQKIQSFEAMLNTTIGRAVASPLVRPETPQYSEYPGSLEELLARALANSPEIRAREKMIASAETKVKMAKKEYYPDFTLNAGYFNRGGGTFPDMWSLTTTMNIPLYYKTKQRQAVFEAEASSSEARQELEAAKLMLASSIRDNYSMHKTAGKLMELYRDGLIPKTYQDFESALAGYTAGKTEAITVINRLKSLIDFELLYWAQFSEREKAIARFEAMAGMGGQGPAAGENK